MPFLLRKEHPGVSYPTYIAVQPGFENHFDPTDRCIKMVKFFQGEIWGKYVVFSEFSAAFAL